MEIELRLEQSDDYRQVEELTKEAFWNAHNPGCDEHYLIHIMRGSGAFIPSLDFVALFGAKIAGNIVYTRAEIISDGGKSYEVLSFGPLSVLPSCQGRKIGSRLINHTKKLAQDMGYKAILIYGDPLYYSRFGFLPAEKFNIRTRENKYHAALLACELYEGALRKISGRFFEDEIYNLDLEASAEFDKSFAYKEKMAGTPSQERFKHLLAMQRDAQI